MKNNTIAEIAKSYLGFETLATRRRDSLDFRDCSVWGVEAALLAAYELGRNSYAADLARHAKVDAEAALIVGDLGCQSVSSFKRSAKKAVTL
jgi:hypothetical protein